MKSMKRPEALISADTKQIHGSSILSKHAIMIVSDAMDAGFDSLKQPYQTPEDRIKLHKKYRYAIRGLRDNLRDCSSSDTPFTSVCLFAMYEVMFMGRELIFEVADSRHRWLLILTRMTGRGPYMWKDCWRCFANLKTKISAH